MKFSSFIKNGFFPKELVPSFNSNDFAEKAERILSSASGYKDKPSRLTQYSIPRLNNTRRMLSLMDPYHYLKLTKLIKESWSEFESAYNLSAYSLTTPIESELGVDSKFPYSEIIYRKCTDSVGYKYMLKTDISRFHSTIYTHMIPWVIHGKENAKIEIKNTKLLGNQLDAVIRKGKDNQTLGIPTGQINFHIISERIAVYIDVELKKRYKKEVKSELEGFRYTDDFYFFFNNKGEAEKSLSILREILAELELELNYLKTQIYELPTPFEQPWVTNIRNYQFNDNLLSERNDIINYFSYIFDYKNKFPDEFVIKYGLARIKNIRFNTKNWELYESLLLQSMTIETSTIPSVIEILLKYKRIGVAINKRKIKKIVENLILEHIKLKHTFEVVWLLWMCKTLKFKINNDILEMLESSVDNFIILVTCDLEVDGIFKRSVNKELWNELITKEGLEGNDWLIIYEGYIKGWLKVDKSIIEKNIFYRTLAKNDIAFYYPNNQIIVEEFEVDEKDILKEILDVIESINSDSSKLKMEKNKLKKLIEKRNKNIGY